jgi:hypothetical protein
MTETHGFRITVARHATPTAFVAEISGYTPPMAQRLAAGKPVQTIRHHELDPVSAQDSRSAVDFAKQRISAEWGQILVFRDQ